MIIIKIVTFEAKLEGSERVNHGATWGELQERTANAKALGQQPVCSKEKQQEN